jgi:hypothetical protein
MEWVVSFTPRPVYPRYPSDRLGWPQSRSGRRREEKNLAYAGIQTPAVQPVAILTPSTCLSAHIYLSIYLSVSDYMRVYIYLSSSIYTCIFIHPCARARTHSNLRIYIPNLHLCNVIYTYPDSNWFLQGTPCFCGTRRFAHRRNGPNIEGKHEWLKGGRELSASQYIKLTNTYWFRPNMVT